MLHLECLNGMTCRVHDVNSMTVNAMNSIELIKFITPAVLCMRAS